MANIKGIELASNIYDLEDETARGDIETNTSKIGNLVNLETTVKTNLVAAINEVNGNVTDINKQIKNIVVTSQTIEKESERTGLTKLASITVPKNSVVTITVSFWNAFYTVKTLVVSEENQSVPYPVFAKSVSTEHPQDGLTVTLCNTGNEDRSFSVQFEAEAPTNVTNPYYLMVSKMLLND